jgi:hypothetical protein
MGDVGTEEHILGKRVRLVSTEEEEEAATGRRIELGEVAYEAYRSRLALHQPEKCLEWHRFPPYMRDVWTYVGEAVIAYEKRGRTRRGSGAPEARGIREANAVADQSYEKK